MTDTNVLAFPARSSNPDPLMTTSLWALFVLEDLKQHFLNTGEDDAAEAIIDSIQKLEAILMPESA